MMASQMKAKVSITKQAKSSPKMHAHDMHRIHDYLKGVYGVTIDTRHCKHERDREWNDEGRGDFQVKANGCTDSGARAAAEFSPRVDGAAIPQERGVGSLTTWSVDGRKVGTDIKHIIADKIAHQHRCLVATAPTIGTTVRMVLAGHANVQATLKARKLMGQATRAAHARAVMGRNSRSMSGLSDAAKSTGSSSLLGWVLDECGSQYRELCPFCFDSETGEGHRDGRKHMRDECRHPAMQLARDLLTAWEAERVVRSGPPGHAERLLVVHGIQQDDEGDFWEER